MGARYTLNGVYNLVRRLRLSCLAPRPRHRKNEPQVIRGGWTTVPSVRGVKDRHPGKRVEVWQQDEARMGQQGTITRVWGEINSRLTTVYEWAYLFAAVDAATGAGSALIAPMVNMHYMKST